MLERLFGAILSVSLSTSIVVLPLLLLTPLLKRRYAAKWRYWVWLFIAVRLLVPINISLPETPLQITIPEALARPFIGAPVLPAVGQELTGMLGAEAPLGSGSSPITLFQGLALVWFAGMIVTFITHIATYRHYAKRTRKFSSAVPAQTQQLFYATGQKMGLARLPALRLCPLIQSPVLFGLFHPILLLPNKAYAQSDMQIILRHELVHFSRRDGWYKIVLLLARGAHWFNPMVWAMSRQSEKDIEFSCDDAVVYKLDANQRALYGQVILDEVSHKKLTTPVLAMRFGSSKRTIAHRLKNLFDVRTKRRGGIALFAVVLAASIMGTLVACVPQSDSNSTGASQSDSVSHNPASDSTSSPLPGAATPTAEMETTESDGKTWYIVENEGQLRSIAASDESLSRNYIQQGDITLTGEWVPIGNEEHPFTGVYSGNGYHISGLSVTAPDAKMAGLFGHVENGTVYNVTIMRPNITHSGATSVSPVVVFAYGGSGSTYGNTVLTGERPAGESGPAVTWDAVATRYYEDGDPYIKDNFTNHTDKAILGYSYAMLAYDADGNPLKMYWYAFDSSSDPAYLNIGVIDSNRGPDSSYYVAPGGTFDVRGGWSVSNDLDAEGNCTAAYVLMCFTEITFADGSIWQNAEYEDWLQTYGEKKVDVKTLENYYPFSQSIA